MQDAAEARLPEIEAKIGGGVQSLHRAMSILRVVARSREGIGLTDLCKAIGLHSSTTFHLAKTLVTLGLLRQDPDSKRYRVGPQLFSLAAGALDEVELLSVAGPFLQMLADEIGESSHIAVHTVGLQVVIIGKVDGSASIRMTERIGTARPAHATAIGKVLLSGMPAARRDALLGSGPLASVTPRTITDVDMFKTVIQQVQTEGIAFDDGEFDAEVRCLGAPVYDFRSRVIAAIGISAPAWRLNLQRVGHTIETLKKAASDLSVALGYRRNI